MNVASLELCQELYEVSGWHNVFNYWNINHPDKAMLHLTDEWWYENIVHDGFCPAYDLGYLLRKLPIRIDDSEFNTIKLQQYMGQWVAGYGYKSDTKSDTPEDAAAKLAIELFKQGVLTKEAQS